jgi:hypothetical protein
MVVILPLLSTAMDVSRTASPQGKVPQFVSITFDNNWIGGTRSCGRRAGGRQVPCWQAPAGNGKSADFDGVPIRTTFFNSSIYAVNFSQKVLGHSGEDWNNRNRLAGKADHGRSRDGERLSINVGFTPGVARLQNTGRSEVLSR